jgi:hypothetical protein
MRREGCDPNDVRMSDVLCDFCEREWNDSLPMVEGHLGSCICGDCLRAAYLAIGTTGAVDVAGAADDAGACRLCREERPERMWVGAIPGACVCRRCVRQSAGVLQKDPDLGWRKPDA